jgi:hypothetical protein
MSGAIALWAMSSLLLAAGCDSDDGEVAARDGNSKEQRVEARIHRGEGDRPDRRSSRSPKLEPATCAPEAGNCRSASGRILYVERVDPDGDGDAHFVLASRQSITGPGISVIDVKRSLRPSPLPGRGDRMSAAGPVYRGSYGQRQIEAVELHVARVR